MGQEGDTLSIGQVLAKIDETASKPGGNGTIRKDQSKGKEPEVVSKEPEKKKNETKAEPAKSEKTERATQQTQTNNQSKGNSVEHEVKATPVASAIIADKKINPSTISPSGVGGKILKDDVLEALTHPGKK